MSWVSSFFETPGTGYIFAGLVVVGAWGTGTYRKDWPRRIERYEELGAHDLAHSARRWMKKMGRAYWIFGVVLIVVGTVNLVTDVVT